MKKISIILTIVICALLAAHFTLAQAELETEYPPIGGVEAGGGLIPYIRYVFIYGLATIGLTALIALVIGGLMYMSSGSITKTDEAKKWIFGALTGLLLGLSAYLILNTINPDLVNLKINLEPVNLPPPDDTHPPEIETCPSGVNKPECLPDQTPPLEIQECHVGNCPGTQRRTLVCETDGCWSSWPNWDNIKCEKNNPECGAGNKTYCPKTGITYKDEYTCRMACSGAVCEKP